MRLLSRMYLFLTLASFVVSIATLILVAVLFIQAPWDSANETQIRLELEQEILHEARQISEAKRLATCKAIGEFIGRAIAKEGPPIAAHGQPDSLGKLNTRIIDNQCTTEELMEGQK